MLTMFTGTEHLLMAAMVWASSVSWPGCAVDTRCGSVAFTLDSLGAAHRELIVAMRDPRVAFLLGSPYQCDICLGSDSQMRQATENFRRSIARPAGFEIRYHLEQQAIVIERAFIPEFTDSPRYSDYPNSIQFL